MTNEDAIKWLENLKQDIGQLRHEDLWHYEQAIYEIISMLKEHDANHKPDCEHAEHDGVGCLGYCGCTQDDEPIEVCKGCEKYTGNVFEAVKWE